MFMGVRVCVFESCFGHRCLSLSVCFVVPCKALRRAERLYRVIKSLCAPDDYSAKTRKNILNSFSHHDNVVRIRDNRWR
jgi:hypothetical protein